MDNLQEESLTTQQKLMESYYQFPYHYISTWDGSRFSQTRTYPWGFEYLSYLYFVIDKLDGLSFQSLLDVGCGDGRFLSEVSQHIGGKHLCGIDYSETAIRMARAFVPNVEWVHGDITDETTLAQTFDVITLIETLEHIPIDKVSDFIDGISQRLNENGRFLLTVPSINIPTNTHHEQHFSYDSLHEILSEKMIIEEVHYLNRNWQRFNRFITYITGRAPIIIRSTRLLGWLFSQYQKRLLISTEKNSQRIFMLCTKRNCQR